jgi:hypothetical protein
MADEPVKFSVNSNIMRLAIAASTARAALGKILKDGKGRLSVYYDDAGALHVVGDHGAPSVPNGAAPAVVIVPLVAEIDSTPTADQLA